MHKHILTYLILPAFRFGEYSVGEFLENWRKGSIYSTIWCHSLISKQWIDWVGPKLWHPSPAHSRVQRSQKGQLKLCLPPFLWVWFVFANVIVWLHGLWGQVLLTGFIILSPSAWIMNALVLELLRRFWNNIPWFQIALNQEHRNMLSFAPDYDHLPLVAKVEVFEYALETTEGNDLARVFILPLCVYIFCSAVTIVHKLHRTGFWQVLWLKSRTSEVWLERRTNYTRSLAVMSMVCVYLVPSFMFWFFFSLACFPCFCVVPNLCILP